MCVLSIKVPILKKSGNLFNDPRISPYLEEIYFSKYDLFIETKYKDRRAKTIKRYSGKNFKK